MSPNDSSQIVGRYAIFGKIASGGMASVHFGRLLGGAGFSRTVAVKRLHPHLAEDEEFRKTLIDEARMVARIHHPNVVPTLDVVDTEGELLLVMEYVRGESLARLVAASAKREQKIPLPIAAAIGVAALHGLHAAHEATDDSGKPLDIVHRDVSPQNILVGVDGMVRVIDFGVAKAARRLQTTQEGTIKGKIAYMPPEQLRGSAVARAADIYAMGVVLWEALAGRRLFQGETEAILLGAVLSGPSGPPSRHRAGISPGVDGVVMKALAGDPAGRFATAREMADALTTALTPALPTVVGDWCADVAKESLELRGKLLSDIESASGMGSVGRIPRARARSDAAIDADSETTVQLVSNPSASAARVPHETSGLTSSGLASGASVRIPGVGKQRKRVIWGGAAAVLLLAASAVYVLGSKKPAPAAVALPQTADSIQPVASVIPMSSAVPPVAANGAPETPIPEVPSTPASGSAMSPRASAPSPKPGNTAPAVPARSKAGVPATAPSAASDHCKPSYTFDANGDKHFKPECFGQ